MTQRASEGDQELRIGVIADTHVPVRARHLPEEVFTYFKGVDLILHAGDIIDRVVLDDLLSLAPVRAVRGNCDPPLVFDGHRLPRQRLVEIAGWRIGLIHGDGSRRTVEQAWHELTTAYQDLDAVVFGHSHQPYVERRDGVLLFNPGSAADRRRQPQCSVGIITVGEGRLEAEHIFYDRTIKD